MVSAGLSVPAVCIMRAIPARRLPWSSSGRPDRIGTRGEANVSGGPGLELSGGSLAEAGEDASRRSGWPKYATCLVVLDVPHRGRSGSLAGMSWAAAVARRRRTGVVLDWAGLNLCDAGNFG